MSHKLDAAVWAKISEVLTHPELIEREVARMRETEDPGAEMLANLDRQLAEVDRRIANKRKFAELVDDDQERAELAADVAEQRKGRRTLEAERVAIEARTGGWREKQHGLERTLDWCARVAGNLDTFTAEERRQTVLTLRAEATLYRADHTPRAELAIHLPLSGAVALPLGDCDDRIKDSVTT